MFHAYIHYKRIFLSMIVTSIDIKKKKKGSKFAK